MRVRNPRRIRYEIFEKQKQQILANGKINDTFFLIFVDIIGITQSILFVFRMNLKNIFGLGQVRKSIKQNHQWP